MSFKEECICFMCLLLEFGFFNRHSSWGLTRLRGVRGSPSGRISGVVKLRHPPMGSECQVTMVCGGLGFDPVIPDTSSWMRMSKAKSSCTVLWQWFT